MIDNIKIPDSIWEDIFSKFTYVEDIPQDNSTYLWSGFQDKNNNIVIGYVSNDKNDDSWYYNSEIIKVKFLRDFFGFETSLPIIKSLKDFLNKKYGFNITTII